MKFSLLQKDAKFTWTQFLAAFTVGMASLVTGYTGGYTAPALLSLRHVNHTIIQNQGYLTTDQETWIGFFVPLGALVGSSFVAGILIEVLGRKSLLMLVAPVFALGWILIGMAKNVPMIYAGRFVCGLCTGLLNVGMPVYLAETIHESVRGMLGMMPTLMGNGGMLLVFVVGNAVNWVVLAYVGAVLPLVYLALLVLIPETPRWLISKSKSDRACAAMQWLRGAKADVGAEIGEIEAFYAFQKVSTESKKLDFDELKARTKRVFVWKNVKPTLICVALMFFQQLSGINAVMFYMSNVFEDAGSTNPGLSTIIVGLANVFATLVSSFCVDRLGRKVLLYVSGSVTAVLLVVVGTYFHFKDTSSVAGYEWIILVALVVYVMAFSFGFGPIPWMMMGELLPANIRGPGASIVTASNWAFAAIVTKTYGLQKDKIGNSWTFWFYGCFCAACVVFVFLCVPETRCKKLEDIEMGMMQNKKDAKGEASAAAGAAPGAAASA